MGKNKPITSKEILFQIYGILGNKGLSALVKLPKYCQLNLLQRLQKLGYKRR